MTTAPDRAATYGHPYDHFGRTASLLNALGFRRHSPSGEVREITREDWPQIMIADKLARNCEDSTHADNRHDIAGYARTWELVVEREGA